MVPSSLKKRALVFQALGLNSVSAVFSHMPLPLPGEYMGRDVVGQAGRGPPCDFCSMMDVFLCGALHTAFQHFFQTKGQ